MWRFLKRAEFRWLPKLFLTWLLAYWPAGAMAQEVVPFGTPAPAPPPGVGLSSGGYQELLDRLGTIEQRLDQVTKQNEDLHVENQTLV